MAYTNCDLILSVKDAEDHKKWLKTRDLGITYREFVIQDAVHAADLMAQRLHWMAEVSDETPHRMADYKEALEDFERLQEKAVNLIKDDYGKWEAENDA